MNFIHAYKKEALYMKQATTKLPSLTQVIISLGLFLLLAFSFTAQLDLPIQLALYIGWFIIITLGIKLFQY
jgi:NhaC family Na+:H+ antiporter